MRDAGKQVVAMKKIASRMIIAMLRRKAFHVRGDPGCKPLDEADAVESIAESDQGAEPREVVQARLSSVIRPKSPPA